MKNITLSTTTAPLTQIAVSEALEEFKAKNITIEAIAPFIYSSAKLAVDNQIKVDIEGKITKPSDIKKSFQKSLFLYSVASCTNSIQLESDKILKSVMNINITELNEEKIIDVVLQSCNTKEKKNIVAKIESQFAARRKEVKGYHTFNTDGMEVIDLPYGPEAVAHAKDNKGVALVNRPMAGGKTSLFAKPLFDELCEDNAFPVWSLPSRALAGSLFPKIDGNVDSRFYLKAVQETRLPEGLFGVVNTNLMSDDLKRNRDASDAMLFDEIEKGLNHMTGKAVGNGSLSDMADINRAFDEQAIKSESLVFCDAMLSEQTAQRIRSLNKKMFVYTGGKETNTAKPKIRIMSEKMLTGLAINKIENKEKIALFCDGSNDGPGSKMRKVEETFKPALKEAGAKHSIIDAKFMASKETSELLNDVAAFTKDNDFIIYNGAADCGLSITDSDYKDVFVLGCKTNSPNELIQAMGRIRPAEVVNLFIDNQYRKPGPITSWGVLCEFMLKECTPDALTKENQEKLYNDKYIRIALDRIAYKNKMSSDYINTVVIMLEQMGYDIDIVDDEVLEDKGNVAIRHGVDSELEAKYESLMKIEEISELEAEKLKSNKEYNNAENQDKLKAFELQQFFNTDKLDADMIEFSDKNGMRTISAMKTARNEKNSLTANQFIKNEMISKFFELNDLCPNAFGEYHADTAQLFQDYINDGEIVLPGSNKVIKVKHQFDNVFLGASLSKTPTATVKSILTNTFALNKDTDIKKGGKKKGNFKFIATPNVINEHYYKIC